MPIKTTIYIKPYIWDKILKAALFFNISTNDIIALIITKSMHNKNKKLRLFRSVEYQKDDSLCNWRRKHVSFDEDIYETGLDLRKILKLSVSRIIADGVEKYLEEIIGDLTNKTSDNYTRCYLFFPNDPEDLYYFTIFWSFPPLEILQKYL